MEELKAEIEKYKDYCRYVEWQMDKVAEKPFFNKEFFIGAIWEIKRQFPGKKIMISYRGAGQKGKPYPQLGNKLRRHGLYQVQRSNCQGTAQVSQDKRHPVHRIFSLL